MRLLLSIGRWLVLKNYARSDNDAKTLEHDALQQVQELTSEVRRLKLAAIVERLKRQ